MMTNHNQEQLREISLTYFQNYRDYIATKVIRDSRYSVLGELCHADINLQRAIEQISKPDQNPYHFFNSIFKKTIRYETLSKLDRRAIHISNSNLNDIERYLMVIEKEYMNSKKLFDSAFSNDLDKILAHTNFGVIKPIIEQVLSFREKTLSASQQTKLDVALGEEFLSWTRSCHIRPQESQNARSTQNALYKSIGSELYEAPPEMRQRTPDDEAIYQELLTVLSELSAKPGSTMITQFETMLTAEANKPNGGTSLGL